MAVTSTAFAQNVTISGRIDIGSASTKTTGSQNQTTAKSDTLAGAHGTKTGSRITFAGTEDLGGGLTAFFNTETALNGGAMSARNLFVGVRGGFGSVQAGRYFNSFSPIRDGHYSIAGGAGGGFLNQHLGLSSSAADTLDKFGVARPDFILFTVNPTSGVVSTTAASSTVVTKLIARAKLAVDSGTGANVVTVEQALLFGYTPASSSTNAAKITSEEAKEIVAQFINPAIAKATADNARNAAELNTLMNAFGNRSQQALSYTAPKFGDFTFSIGLDDSNIVSNDPRTDRPGQNQAKTSSQSYSLAYASGPLSARVTMGQGKVTTETQGSPASNTAASVTASGVSSAKGTDNALMVSYNFGVAQAYVMHNETESKLSQFRGAAANAKRETEATEIGVKMPLGAFEPFVTIGRGEVKTSNAGAAGTATNIKTSAYQLGLNYNLSKRTQVYFSTGEMKAKTTANTNKTTGTTLGLVHNF